MFTLEVITHYESAVVARLCYCFVSARSGLCVAFAVCGHYIRESTDVGDIRISQHTLSRMAMASREPATLCCP